MTITTHLAKAAAVAALLAACAPTPREAAKMEPKAGTVAFQDALHDEYAELALKERRLADWIDAYHFADKAANSAAGEFVAPADPTDDFWDVPDDHVPELLSARARTMNYVSLNAGTQPTRAAALQGAYDCWVEEIEEGHQQRAIAACKTAWYQLASDYGAYDARIVAPAPNYYIVTRPVAYTVFFDFDKATLDSADRAALDGAAAYIRQNNLGDVEIVGHTDRSGDRGYNQRLSAQRAQAVADYLKSRGVSARVVDIYAMGERDPMVATGDGKREPLNRRVVIDVTDDV
ncbi:MAG: OmpA family protein [Alphaproteobacteria bacterium]|nr:OmpA family protein [Alphaproteobacteria bacterium]